jgi:hypothetical protein
MEVDPNIAVRRVDILVIIQGTRAFIAHHTQVDGRVWNDCNLCMHVFLFVCGAGSKWAGLG